MELNSWASKDIQTYYLPTMENVDLWNQGLIPTAQYEAKQMP